MNQEELDRYTKWINTAEIDPEREVEVADAVGRALVNRPRLEAVGRRLSIPWTLLAALQELEAGGRMDRHPANGEKLTARTKLVPRGLPRHVSPPFTYENVAAEELAEIQRPPDGVWTLQEMCHAAEHFNGTGYRKRGLPSPYVVSGTTLLRDGKYIADGKFDPEARSKQVGCLALWIAMREAGIEVP